MQNRPSTLSENSIFGPLRRSLPILSIQQITAAHAREGNVMSKRAIELYMNGEFGDAVTLLYDAIGNYGSSTAMRIIQELTKFPGCIQMRFDDLIDQHSKHESFLFKEAMSAVFPSKREDCQALFVLAQRDFKEGYFNSFSYAMEFIWREDKGISKSNVAKLEERFKSNIAIPFPDIDISFASIHLRADQIPPSFRSCLDVEGFCGFNPPLSPDAWYIKSRSPEDSWRDILKV